MRAYVGILERGMIGVPFLYDVPDSLRSDIHVGTCVAVPLGAEEVRGMVLALFEQRETSFSTFPITRVVEHPLLCTWPTSTCQWMQDIAERYYSPFHRVMRVFFPEKIWYGTFRPAREVRYVGGPNPPSTPLLMSLATFVKQQPRTKEELTSFSSGILRKALQLGVVAIEEGELLRVQKMYTIGERPVRALTIEQQQILNQILQDPTGEHVLHGVTGAGKTEIYMHLAQQTAARGLQTLLLVPEIALTPQLLQYVSQTFGHRVAVFHSHLTENEKSQEWMRVLMGDVDVVLGSRSALFAPFQKLGLVIVDEEHEWTYKNEQHPRYYTHSALGMLYRHLPELTIVYGSATPSIELIYRIPAGRIHRLDLKVYEQTPSSREGKIL